MKKLPIVEIFGPTIAGEGNIAGQLTMFLRTGYCDYRCSWCDSMHAVIPEEVMKRATWMEPREVAQAVADVGWAPWVSISGGNPAMHAHLDVVVEDLRTLGFMVNVETQGTLWQDWLVRCQTVTVSPKPPSSGMASRGQGDLRKIMDLPQAILKIVAFDQEDLEWAQSILERFPERPAYISIGTDPQDTRESLLDRYAEISEHVLANEGPLQRATFLPQMHVLMWGHGQGF